MKDEIIKIAEEQMRAGGYDALNFRKIAETLNISKANVHHHFKNKETLALKVTEMYSEEHYKAFQMIANNTSGDILAFVEQIEELFWKMAKDSGHCSVCVCSQITKTKDAPLILKQHSGAHYDRISQIIVSQIQKSIDNGQIKSKLSAAELGIQAGMMEMGLMAMSQMAPSVEEAEKMFRGHIKNWVITLTE